MRPHITIDFLGSGKKTQKCAQTSWHVLEGQCFTSHSVLLIKQTLPVLAICSFNGFEISQPMTYLVRGMVKIAIWVESPCSMQICVISCQQFLSMLGVWQDYQMGKLGVTLAKIGGAEFVCMRLHKLAKSCSQYNRECIGNCFGLGSCIHWCTN